ncbi:UDP-N-acetylmuramoyl-L-alanyl-D-glutamate--2,6-diaminopimelate ligase MurE homolog, chloroplastic isoform X2 [Elaeis guineensis]|uniref:UDP-N-acetylmuramoyl-L-alanyl-D-glutamate--2, 6-diaminopimelate ligase MurE homolog, chloroplastic isoform X2 n=1 Tax=Elaeis guineensis var. tenera TaxID=51953 RepID=A0A8N4IGL2_ELAGV|nr:UDP-N-acetylmuramoyl-L-alanyl-D-glutamate--2,6-diaminopimelate ligase MurE homolog, chloroplastic isoform X2 [Elaeis guineensis]
MALYVLPSLFPFTKPPSPLLSLHRVFLVPSVTGSDSNSQVRITDDLSGGSSKPQSYKSRVLCGRERSALVSETPASQNLDCSSQNDILGDIDRTIALKRPHLGLTGHRSLNAISEYESEQRLDHQPLVSSSKLDNGIGSRAQVIEPEFKTTLAELMDESRVRPVSLYGDLEVLITGIQNDSRKVTPGDLFVCCLGCKTDGHLYLMDAVSRGAIAVVASKDVNLDEIQGCRALVMVENTDSILPVLAATFYKHPSKRMSVIGITGTNGKTTTSHLVKAIFEAMSLRTGMLGTIGYYIHGDTQLEAPNTTPDAVMVQKLMAKMVHSVTEAAVMEVSSHGLALGRCDEIDFNIAVFTNLTRDHFDFHRTEEEYRNSKAKLFSRMVDPKSHHKIVNIDDPNAPFFVAQGNPDVPVLTFAMENEDADVFPLKFELSLFKTQVLIITPKGILEITTGLIGRHNVYNILAAVTVGIAVGVPLEAIVRGIERVEGVSGRCELIGEGHPFGVIVDFAHTPDALSRILDTVRELGARRIITVFGCAGESDRGKRSMMTKIATDKSEVVFLTSDNPKTEHPLDILDDMLAGVGWTMQDYVQYGKSGCCPPLPNGHKLFVHDIRRVAIRAAVAMAEKGDIVNQTISLKS